MTVFVLTEVHFYPDIDGGNEILGVYSSRKKAEIAREEKRQEVIYYLGNDGKDCKERDAYDLTIDEFEIE